MFEGVIKSGLLNFEYLLPFTETEGKAWLGGELSWIFNMSFAVFVRYPSGIVE